MCVIAAFFARVFLLSLGRPCTGFLLIRHEIRAICKTRNQLMVLSMILLPMPYGQNTHAASRL